MKKVAIILCLLAITGCTSQSPMSVNLHPMASSQPEGIYPDTVSATLSGHDGREQKSVVMYQLDSQPAMALQSAIEPHRLLTDQLARGLLQQGLVFVGGAPVHLQLNLKKFLARVTRPGFLYSTDVESLVSLVITNGKNTLTKTYARQTLQQSALRPSVTELEKMLDAQANEIINQILQDEQVRAAIARI